MERKRLPWILVSVTAAIIVTAAVAVAPTVLNAQSPDPGSDNPGSPEMPDTPGGGTGVATLEAPQWHQGDTWTYNVSTEDLRAEMPTDEGVIVGTITRTVLGNVTTDAGWAYNVSTRGEFRLGGMWDTSDLDAVAVRTADVSGYAWYRVADLAKIRDVRTVAFAASADLFNVTVNVTYRATTTTDFRPPLAVWDFPTKENETWSVASNASVRFTSRLVIEAGDATFETNRLANFTAPVRFGMAAGVLENVTTDAGTFESLPVTATAFAAPIQLPDRIAGVLTNLTEESFETQGHAFAKLWFSEKVGNVVRAEGWLGDLFPRKIAVDLVSYVHSG